MTATSVQAATLVVSKADDSPYQTIQAAIDDAVPGVDDVLVRCGRYVENVVMRDGVSLRGENPRCTTIDGGGLDSTVRANDVGPGTELSGFTITGGLGSYGGGVRLFNSALVVEGNRIEGNSTVLFTGGGGIAVDGNYSDGSPPEILRNVITGNTSSEGGGGIELFSGDGVLVHENLIVGNSADIAGGGICVLSGSHQLINNTIVRNCPQTPSPSCDIGGGGIAVVGATLLLMRANIVAWNEAAFGGDGIDVLSGPVTFIVNNIFDNGTLNVNGVPDPTGTNGNLSVDPMFADEQVNFGGFEPRSDSPMIDAAGAAIVGLQDLRGVPRRQDGDASGGANTDIGARENEGLTRLLFPTAGNKGQLGWDAASGAGSSYNLYRGELDELRATGVYIQDPATVAGARSWCGLPAADQTDTDLPPAGEGFIYLAVAEAAVEGSLGYSSNLSQRPMVPANSCP